jgi:hypothetical protein
MTVDAIPLVTDHTMAAVSAVQYWVPRRSA